MKPRERVRLVRRENIPTLPASDWSTVRIYLRFLRLIGQSHNETARAQRNVSDERSASRESCRITCRNFA
eukprot:7787849-Pyramimonas_sp.AAC.1